MSRDFPRTARLNHLIHEIVADELERIDDDRLGFLTVVAVDVEADIKRATVWYTTLSDPAAEPGTEPEGDDLVEALEEHRRRVQAAIARQARIKRTPELTFRPDPVARTAGRVESILREIATDESR